MLNMLIACVLLNVQYAHCMCIAQRLTYSVYVHHTKKITRCPVALNECMQAVECSVCLLNVRMLECPLLARAVCLVCVQKKEVSLGEIRRSEAA